MSADLDAIALAAAKAVYPFGPATYCWGDDAKNDAARERDWKAIAKRISLTAGFTDAVTEAIAQDRKTRELRAEDGLRQIDEIAHEIISNPGLEKNTVDLVSEMVMWFKTYKQQLAQQSAALVACKEAMAEAWQDIETAPKDQTRILCSYHGNRPFIARWRNDFSVFMDDWDSWRDATHWMPLPPSPNIPVSNTDTNT